MATVFVPQPSGNYDLVQDGRVLETEVEPWDLHGAVSRRRIKHKVWVEDEDGRQSPLGR